MAERQKASKEAQRLMKMERDELEQAAAERGIASADRVFVSEGALQFVLLDGEYQRTEQRLDRLLGQVGAMKDETGLDTCFVNPERKKLVMGLYEVAEEIENERGER